MRSFFFNAEPTEDIAAHPTGYDREYDADDHAAFFEPFFSAAGVMAQQDADACKVSVQSGSTLKIAAGCCYVKGRMCQFDGTETLEATADGHVVARMNKTAEVRAFQFLVVEELVYTDDIWDLELAQVTLQAVTGGYAATVTDKRTFMAFSAQPPYYPPDSDSLPYVLWLYALGFPMTDEQRASVTGNPSLMAIFNASLGAMKGATVTFTAANWTGDTTKTLTIPLTQHGRQSGAFGYTLRHQVDGVLVDNTWAVKCTKVTYDSSSKAITLTSDTAYDGEIAFFG